MRDADPAGQDMRTIPPPFAYQVSGGAPDLRIHWGAVHDRPEHRYKIPFHRTQWGHFRVRIFLLFSPETELRNLGRRRFFLAMPRRVGGERPLAFPFSLSC